MLLTAKSERKGINMTFAKFAISMPPDLLEKIDMRGGPRATTIQNVLASHFYAMEQSLAYWRSTLILKELYLIVSALADVKFSDPRWIDLLPSYVNTVIEQANLNLVWDIDHNPLIEKLANSTTIDKFALVDAVKRFKLSEDDMTRNITALLAPPEWLASEFIKGELIFWKK